MKRRDFLSVGVALAPVAAAAVIAVPRDAGAQQLGEGMDRSGVLDIRNDLERQVFGDLQCTCGCPRESLGTCTCEYAAGFRSEVRAMLARGLTREEIKAEWVRIHGPEALTVPANTGAKKLVYLAPLAAIGGMAAFAVVVLRRFRETHTAHSAREAQAQAHRSGGAAGAVAPASRDEYDDKLDEELRRLDDE